MKLDIQYITENHPHISMVYQLYNSAFPNDEKAPFDMLLNRVQTKEAQFLAFYDNKQFCGLTYLVFYKKTIYIFYLAIVESMRSQGYGSQILKMIQEKYSNYSLFLDIEVIDQRADNYIQRLKRKEFYERQGFHSSGYEYNFYHVDYEVLNYGHHFSIIDCQKLFDAFSHGNIHIEFHKIRHR